MAELPDVIHLPGPAAPSPARKPARRGSETRVRQQAFYVRLTNAERAEIEAAAKAAGFAEVGAYARHMALNNPEQRGSEQHETSRPTRLPFRVTEVERAKIEDRADRAGLTPGSYIRARALQRPVTLTTRRPPIDKADLARLLGLLGLAGSNINQVARQLNSDGAVPLVDVREAIAQVQTAAVAIIESLGRKAE